MNNSELTRAFLEKGWEIRYRGGNSICSTPSDLEMIVADEPTIGGDTSRSPEARPRFSIAAWPAAGGDGEPRPPVFDLYDAERDVEVRVNRIPTPEEAARLLERGDVGESEPQF